MSCGLQGYQLQGDYEILKNKVMDLEKELLLVRSENSLVDRIKEIMDGKATRDTIQGEGSEGSE